MQNKPIISIITPIYKGNKYIPGLLKMVQQNAKNFEEGWIELVLVNDSPEIELNVDKTLIAGFSLQIVNNKKNLGIQGARIAGVEVSNGEYILMLDQDDEIFYNTLSEQFNKLKGNSAVVSNGYFEDSDAKKISLYKSISQQHLVNNLAFYCYYGNMIASPGICLIRKDKIPKIWKEHVMTINGADDWLLWVGYLLENQSFSMNHKHQYIHKKVGNNASDDEEKMIRSSIEALEIVRSHVQLSKEEDRLMKTYSRRLDMRLKILNNGIFNKIYQYLKNFDIAIYVLYFKFVVLFR